MDNNLALINEFLIESFENLSQINSKLFHFEKNPQDKEILNDIYRTIHTLKGSASFLGFKKLQEITHSTENILDLIRSDQVKLNSHLVDILLKSFDFCMTILKNVEKNQTEGDINTKEMNLILLATLEKLAKGDLSLSALSSKFTHELVSENSSHYKDLSKKSEIQTGPTASLVLEEEIKEVIGAKDNNELKEHKESTITDSVVRVNVKLLDKIMNVVGELVLNRNQILQYSNKQESPDLSRLTQQLDIITSELQTEIMLTRMQPIGSVLQKFERVIRDLAKDQGKKIKLKISGQDTELDKTLIEAIKDPLTHIIRNAADHGLENPEERKQSGKNPEGQISIRAYHESGQVTIEISDDGKGINRERVLAKAVEKNLISKEQSLKYSEGQILNLIFLPGFSTAEKVTNISGRGVGMDVVKTNIEKIGGSVQIQSELGHGTTFKLKIPLTLAIVPALMVKSKSEIFAIPQINLVELVRFEQKENIKITEKIHDAEFIRLRGNLIPIFRINQFLKLDQVAQKSEMLSKPLEKNSITQEEANSNQTTQHQDDLNIVILNAEGQVFGLVVDSILDTQEIVVKPLDRILKELNTFAGATVLGDGSVALIVDALGFYNSTGYSQGKHQELQDQESNQEINNGEKQDLLLVRLNDNKTYAIPLSLVSRLEEFSQDQLEYTGSQPIMRYLDRPMPLLNLEKTLKMKQAWVLEAGDGGKTFSSVVINLKRTNYGLIVKEILDIAITDANISSNVVDRDGILGTVFVNEKIISLLDIYKIIELQNLGAKSFQRVQENDRFPNTKVLLVDDSPLYRKMESDALSELGIQLLIAKDGVEALEILDSNSDIKLVVSDIEMPRMNGFELAQKIRTHKVYSKVPIIAVSTRVSDKDLEEGRKVGFSLHLEKLKKDELLDKVQSFLRA
jgi:two-component system chemotaxis sensor kinase CheA